jgi:hypothetical protein
VSSVSRTTIFHGTDPEAPPGAVQFNPEECRGRAASAHAETAGRRQPKTASKLRLNPLTIVAPHSVRVACLHPDVPGPRIPLLSAPVRPEKTRSRPPGNATVRTRPRRRNGDRRVGGFRTNVDSAAAFDLCEGSAATGRVPHAAAVFPCVRRSASRVPLRG